MCPKKLPGSTWLNLHWCALLVRLAVWRWKADVVHAQSHFAAGVASKALRKNPNTKLVFDVHGVDIEEALADGRLRERSMSHQIRLAMQREAIERADWMLTVSVELGKHLCAPLGRVRIVPCVSSLPLPKKELEEVRCEARERLGIANQPVTLYLGGASAWQRPGFLVECFHELLQLEPQAVMLIITHDSEEFAQLLSARGIADCNYRIRSMPHNEVAGMASAADAGLLLRENTIVNRVASPTKFAEYLAVGVPVLLTDALSDFASIVKQLEVGRVVDSSAAAQTVAGELKLLLAQSVEQKQNLRHHCREAFASHLSFDSILPIYHEIYAPRKSNPPTSQIATCCEEQPDNIPTGR
jgi:glycosyltransferase involved in cell wall biosynthesis